MIKKFNYSLNKSNIVFYGINQKEKMYDMYIERKINDALVDINIPDEIIDKIDNL